MGCDWQEIPGSRVHHGMSISIEESISSMYLLTLVTIDCVVGRSPKIGSSNIHIPKYIFLKYCYLLPFYFQFIRL